MTSRLSALLGRGFLLGLCAMLFACSPEVKFQLTDVTGAEFGKTLELQDHNGQARNLKQFQGQVVVVIFGYTQCPDFCPTALSQMTQVLKELGSEASKVQVLFVTVDPERDSPSLLKAYVTAFNPTFLGLWGDAAATLKVTKEFKIVVQKNPSKGEGYSVAHSSHILILDQHVRLRLFAPNQTPTKAFVADLSLLIKNTK